MRRFWFLASLLVVGCSEASPKATTPPTTNEPAPSPEVDPKPDPGGSPLSSPPRPAVGEVKGRELLIEEANALAVELAGVASGVLIYSVQHLSEDNAEIVALDLQTRARTVLASTAYVVFRTVLVGDRVAFTAKEALASEVELRSVPLAGGATKTHATAGAHIDVAADMNALAWTVNHTGTNGRADLWFEDLGQPKRRLAENIELQGVVALAGADVVFSAEGLEGKRLLRFGSAGTELLAKTNGTGSKGAFADGELFWTKVGDGVEAVLATSPEGTRVVTDIGFANGNNGVYGPWLDQTTVWFGMHDGIWRVPRAGGTRTNVVPGARASFALSSTGEAFASRVIDGVAKIERLVTQP
jgi:hypothetical protein